ncbi:hypothetical protein [Actinokineospora globicatena]|uniref:hypothetical protein n=1 Tax=Actinokineospora globicatena TaxID=103729 RepID=UPI0020A5C8E7|nr:hypothetical protein [Actinokineospora globicatena]MCP2302891.1 hypothetical protein [Actinokineospora globicatena]GLW78726.1 hypothetical protein Aglo01_32080 [Actinokineospora globicatena]GLW84606.1 hypothetical protein Aglo02_22460 [Actinokineospora globicatena]
MTKPAQQAYGRRERREDRRRGRRDGKQRTPAFNDVLAMVARDGVITAPYPQYLQSIALDEMTELLATFVRQSKPRLEALEVLRTRYANTKKELDRATDGVDAAEEPLTEEELLPRSRAEARSDQTVVLRSRRTAARARRITAAHAAELETHNRLGELDNQIAATAQAIRSEFVLTQTRAKQVSARGAMRVSAYWEHLVHAHAEGTYLAPLIRYTSQVLPTWVFEPATGAPETLGQGDYELRQVIERVHPPDQDTGPEPGCGPEEHKESA